MNIEHYEAQCPNHWNGRQGQIPDMICMHITEGPTNSAINWFKNPTSYASSHFIVGSDGRIAQMVALKDGAWCNGDYNNPTSTIVKQRGASINPNTYTFSIEHEGYSYKERFGALTEKQYQASLYCCKLFIDYYQNTYNKKFSIDREHIIGHYQINPSGKPNCPSPNNGANFLFDRLIKDLKEYYEMKYEIGTHLYSKEDVKLYSTAGYPNSVTSTLKKGTECIVKNYHDVNGLYMAITDINGEYFNPATWTNELDKFTTEKQIVDLQPKVDELEKEIVELEKKIEELEKEVAELTQSLANKQKELKVANDTIESKTSEIALKEANIKALENEIKVQKETENKLNEKIYDYDKLIIELQNKIKELEQNSNPNDYKEIIRISNYSIGYKKLN